MSKIESSLKKITFLKIKSHKILNIQEIYIGQQKNFTFNLVSPFSTDKAIFGIKIQL